MHRTILMAVAACVCVGTAFAADAPKAEERKGDVWPLNVCVVSGEELGGMGEPVVKVYDGREVRFCCNGCVKNFEKSKASFLEKADKQIMEQQAANYPLETCLNSGAALGDEPVLGVVGNRLVKTCCGKCMAALQKDPAAAVAKLDEAVIAKQKAAYKGTTCPVSGHEIKGEGTDVVIAGTYVKLCCADCKAAAEKDPTGTIAKAMGKK